MDSYSAKAANALYALVLLCK